jgi:DNA mismatch endonuclease (patch repair protein)
MSDQRSASGDHAPSGSLIADRCSPSTDVFTPAQRSAVMARVRGKDTKPELQVRRLLHRMGYRYRLHRRDLPGSPDLAFAGRKAALFVHGCFWHGHDCPRGARQPKQNAAYWSAKIARNRARDAETEARLSALGWLAVTVWECELRDEPALAARLKDELGRSAQALRNSACSSSDARQP